MNKSDIMKAAELARKELATRPKLQDYPSHAHWKIARDEWEQSLDGETYAQLTIAAASLLKEGEEKYQNPMYSIEPSGDTRLVDAQYFYDLTAQREAALKRLNWFESQVEVLREGELPRIGDLVTNTHLGNRGRECSGIVESVNDTQVTVVTAERHNGKRYFVESIRGVRIILRAGKPVIIDKEGV